MLRSNLRTTWREATWLVKLQLNPDSGLNISSACQRTGESKHIPSYFGVSVFLALLSVSVPLFGSSPGPTSDPGAGTNIGTAYGETNSVAFQVRGPVVTSISPTSASPGQTVNVTFTGSNLSSATGVRGWGKNATVSNVSASNSTVTATFVIGSQAAIQTYNLSLVTSMGNSNKVAFQVVRGSVPTLSVSTNTLDFGNDPVGTADTLPLTLTSTGTAAVTVSSGSISGTGFSMAGATFPITLNPGVAVTIQVQFDPPGAATDTGTIALSSNSSTGSTTNVSLSGTGTHWVDLSWTAPTNSSVQIAGYNVYRALSGSSTFQQLNSSVITQTTYADDSVTSGSSYTYYVESVGTSGGVSVPSSNVTVNVP